MIHVGLLLLVGGIACALLREQKKKKQIIPGPKQSTGQQSGYLPAPENGDGSKQPEVITEPVFDDVTELKHYQKISWYGLALTSSGALFYPPATLASLPLLGYNAYYFFKTLKHSRPQDQRSAVVIFEGIGIVSTLLLARPLISSIVMAIAFTKRSVLLQAGNISNNINPSEALQMHHSNVWVLRDGVELEIRIADLTKHDIVVFYEGDTLNIEGLIVGGAGEVSQFSLKKKMKSIEKSIGDRVFPFTRLKSGCLYVSPI